MSGIYEAVKSGSQSVTSSTVLVNETDLAVTMGASDNWIVTWELPCTWNNGTGTGGIKVAVTTPTSATLQLMVYCTPASGNGGAGQTTTSGTGVSVSNVGGISAGTSGLVTVVATVKGDGTHSGTITLQFAQTSSSGTATTIVKGASVVGYLQ